MSAGGDNLSLIRSAFLVKWLERKRAQLSDISQRSKGLPIEFRQQGLMQTVAKLLHKPKPLDLDLVELLSDWLLTQCPLGRLEIKQRQGHRLLSACAAADRTHYRDAQVEAYTLLEQLKLLSVAYHNASQGASGSSSGSEAEPTQVPGGQDSAASPQSGPHRARLKFAFEQVLGWDRGNRLWAAIRCRSLPMEINAQGLLPAVSVLSRETTQKRGEGSRLLAQAITDWLLLRADRKPLPTTESEDPSIESLLGRLSGASSIEYRAASHEGLMLSQAVKIYSNALVSEAAGGEAGGQP